MLGGGAWHGRGRHSAMERAVERLWGDAWAPARSKTRPGGLSTAPATLHSGGGRENREKELEVEEKGCFAISKNSRDRNVKQG